MLKIDYKRSFFLGILGLIVSLYQINSGFGIFGYPLLVLSILVILLGFWQMNKR